MRRVIEKGGVDAVQKRHTRQPVAVLGRRGVACPREAHAASGGAATAQCARQRRWRLIGKAPCHTAGRPSPIGRLEASLQLGGSKKSRSVSSTSKPHSGTHLAGEERATRVVLISVKPRWPARVASCPSRVSTTARVDVCLTRRRHTKRIAVVHARTANPSRVSKQRRFRAYRTRAGGGCACGAGSSKCGWTSTSTA